MAKVPRSSNRPKGATTPADSLVTDKDVGATHKGAGGAHKKVSSRTGRIIADSRADRALASRILRDISEAAGDLSARADRLLRRVS